MKPGQRFPGAGLRLLLLCALLVPASAACTRKEPAPESTPAAQVATEDVSQYRERLGPELWAQVEDAAWLDGEKATPDGARLLEVIASGGPLVSQERRLALLAAYPEGLSEERLSVAGQYARMTIRGLHDVLDAAWLLDGVDDYERAVLDAAGERTISPSALKLAIEKRFFFDLYRTDPKLLTSRRIDALGSLDPAILARAEQEPWFKDGLDDYDVSLLGILADVIQVNDAIAILETHAYRPLHLANTTLAVVLVGDLVQLNENGFHLVQDSIRDVEAFVGDFQSIGLIIDTTAVPGDPFCHGDGGNEYSVGSILLTSDGCFYEQVVVHELAHAFIGGRYPAWFTEGVAEMVTNHIMGAPAGYGGGTGYIEPEGYYFVGSGAYINQASLGSDLLVELYDLEGPEAMSRFARDIAGQRLSGQQILTRIRAVEGIDRPALERLLTRYFGPSLPPPASGVPAATPPPANR